MLDLESCAVVRTDVPLVSVDTSIELAHPFGRELPLALELAAAWGAPVVRVFGGDASDLAGIARRLAGELHRAHELGVAVALETHDAFSRAALVGALLDRVDDPAFGAVWDLHHPHRAGESPEEVVAALGPRIRLVHVKDARSDGTLVPLGEGDVPVRESLALLGDVPLVVEWEKRWHPELDEPEVALPRERLALGQMLQDR
ncbi:MAG: TIM barrel protein [Actinobacteria bacterium]|nr:TIM barrel protein [Actinomycetota bacterium]MBV8479984.1 TIM barrel protein [Actinomycetota bacterium]